MDPKPPEDVPTDSLFKGLKAAFGERRPPKTSVLNALQARARRRLGVHLQDPGHSHEPPVKVSEAVKSLRDPHGRYQILGEIARGGMGVVYKGRDVDLGRDVAMKILQDRYLDEPGVLERFVEEAQIGGQLQHPGIVPVYELGVREDERPYFAMKLIKGETLAERLARRMDPSTGRRRFLGFFEQVCQTVAFAHARRVVHRDLKPANVMIGSFGEVQVMDWGLSKVLPKGGVADERESMLSTSNVRSVIATVRSKEGSGSESVVGSVLGTPAYMSPEQASGNVDNMDRRSDVFGLGAILCEILTGAPPYRTENGDLVQQAARADLQDAKERLRECDADEALVTLCLQCLSPARRARPQSAKQVAEVLGEYLSSVEERARAAELSAVESRIKARSTKILAAVALAVLSLGGGTFIVLQDAANDRRVVADQRRADAEQVVAQAMSGAIALVGEARGNGDLGLWDQAMAALGRAEIAAESVDVSEETRDDVGRHLADARLEQEAARDQAERIARDEAMVARLKGLRVPRDEDVRNRTWPAREARRLDGDYSGAFEDYLGTSLRSMSDAEAIDALSGGPLGLEVQLAAALDHWALERDRLSGEADPLDPGLTERLRRLALGLDPEDPWRNELRGLLALLANRRDELEELARDALSGGDEADSFGGQPATFLVLLGEALQRTGSPDLAVQVYRRGQEVYPDDFWMAFRLALLLERLERPRWDQAVEAYKVAAALEPDMREVRHRMGIAYEKQEDYGSASRIFAGLVARDPENGNWVCHVAQAWWHLDETDRAVAAYERAIQLNPDDTHVRHSKASFLANHGDMDGAISTLLEAVDANPEDAHAYAHLSSWLPGRGRLVEAVQLFRDATRDNPEAAWAHNYFGIALWRQGNLVESMDAYQQALDLEPSNPLYHHNLGIALNDAGELESSEAAYRKAIGLAPRYANAHYSLGNLLRNMAEKLRVEGDLEGDEAAYREAIAEYLEAIAISPRWPNPVINLGIMLTTRGDYAEAIAVYSEAIDQGLGNNIGIRNGLAWAQVVDPQDPSHNPVRAVDLIEAIPPNRRSAAVWNTLGLAYYRAGNDGKAMEALNRSMNLGQGRTGDGNDWIILALVNWRLEDEEEANFRYDIAVEWMAGHPEEVTHSLVLLREEAKQLLGR